MARPIHPRGNTTVNLLRTLLSAVVLIGLGFIAGVNFKIAKDNHRLGMVNSVLIECDLARNDVRWILKSKDGDVAIGRAAKVTIK